MRSTVALAISIAAVCIGVLGAGCSGSGSAIGGSDAATESAADAGAGEALPDVCQGPVCGGACCSQYQTGCGIDVGTGLEVCCDTQQNFICSGSQTCCSKQTSRCVLDADPDSGLFHSNICVSCQDAGCD